MGFFDIVLILASPLMLLGLSIVFVRRALVHQFRYFFCYIVYSVIATALRLPFIHSPVYFWMFWSTDFIYDVLAFLTMLEVFSRVFPPTYPLFRSLRWILPVTTLVLLGISLYATLYTPIAGVPRIVSGINWFNIGVHFVEGIFLPLVIVLILIFGVPWPRYEIGILGGFAVSAYSIMLFSLLRIQGGQSYATLYRYGPPIGFTVATVIWLWTFIWRRGLDKPATPSDVDQSTTLVP